MDQDARGWTDQLPSAAPRLVPGLLAKAGGGAGSAACFRAEPLMTGTGTWTPVGLAIHERWSSEVTCEDAAVRAVVRVSRLRVGVDFSPRVPGGTSHLALAAAHRLAAQALESMAGSEGWWVAMPHLYLVTGGARAVLGGPAAPSVVSLFFGPAVAAALERGARRGPRRQLALGTGGP